MQKYLTWGYLIVICAFLPVYMKDGYYMLGEAKGVAFMVIAGLFSLGFILVNNKEIPSKVRAEGLTDYAALFFLFSNVITFIFSSDKIVSLLGLEGWRCGFLSVLFMVISFYGFREVKMSRYVLTAALVAPLMEFVLGSLNRFGIYPVDIYGQNSSFLATIGNINWYVGFMSVFVPLGIGVGYTRRLFSRSFVLAGAYTLTGLVALLLQGSDSGLIVIAGAYLLLLFVSLEIRDGFKRFLLQLLILGLAMEIVCLLMLFVGRFYTYENSLALTIAKGHWGLVMVAAALFLYRLSRFLEEIKSKWRGKLILEVAVVLMIVGVFALILWFSDSFGLEFGNGRGVIWSISLELYKGLSPWQKMVGVGQDCFYGYAYSHPEIAEQLLNVFKGDVLTNAHCEPFTILIERGLLGLCSYLFLIGSCLYAYFQNKRKSAAIICALPVFAYFLNSLVSFSTTVSTPYMFILLGMGAHYCRENNH
ncbi:O-antigen ligase family protein [Butyrivibrio sp. AE2032]|uniref:O-antigen ligase family protein n=1 Tax=Butyrivibrio sp. AE2032 TaxID=1458463 RepID=UPI00054DCD01|nr:O-antigen ligase family protein [Butyrivibrio sp. AE2032]